jgi:hypothetical protein
MLPEEFSNQMDVLYNNVTSNQAPGLTEYEKSVFLTKAQNEIVKNYFTANSKGNNIGQGFDDSAKRQADFSCLMVTKSMGSAGDSSIPKIDDRSFTFQFPDEAFVVINEAIYTTNSKPLQVLPLRYDEYIRLMSKPFKRPLKNQAWRLINGMLGTNKIVELIVGPGEIVRSYIVRFIKKPKPIIVGDLEDLTIDGYSYGTGNMQTQGCELDSILHEDILQRAVELAKVAWTATGQDNIQPVLQTGQRSE